MNGGSAPGLLTDFAPAKINLFLHVLGRRPDGYHLLDSLAVFADVGDILTAAPHPTLSLVIEGPFGAALAAEPDNLVLRAARALGPGGARLVLDKRLPVASGIGGGSADAAAALRLLARLWGTDVPGGLAVSIGADVPVCLERRPVRMGGIGETLAPAPGLPPCGLLLVNPGIAVATAAVFRAREGSFRTTAPTLAEAWPDAAALARELQASTANDLQDAALQVCPLIGEVLAAITAAGKCLLTRMSGSGATCFGLYADAAAAEAARQRLPARGWWSWAGGLFDGSGENLAARAGGTY